MQRWITIMALMLSFTIKGQDYLVIDSTQSNLVVRNIFDTLWNSLPCDPPLSLWVDINNDGIHECTFRSECASGSWGNYEDLLLNSNSQDFFFRVDNNVIDSTHIIATGQYIVDTFTIVWKHTYGDTIFSDGIYFNSLTTIVHNHHYPPGYGPGSSLSLTDWVGGDHYIGFIISLDDIEYLGWLKVEVVSTQKIIVKQAVYFNPDIRVPESDPIQFKHYPNPAHDYFSFVNKDFKELIIFNTAGQVYLKESLSPGKQTINIQSLSPGFYIVLISGSVQVHRFALIKQ